MKAESWGGGGLPHLNVAETCVGTDALGPGLRGAIWVQGCPFRCHGCLAPEWIPMKRARYVEPSALAEELVTNPEITGLTFSGGEPMLQAAGLAALARQCRAYRSLSLICFTGFTYAKLLSQPPSPGVDELLKEVDVLIDGPYVASRNDGHGLRGSNNQRVLHLTDRLSDSAPALLYGQRIMEVHIRSMGILEVGVPPLGLSTVVQTAVGSA